MRSLFSICYFEADMSFPSIDPLFITSNFDFLGPFFISSTSMENDDLFKQDFLEFGLGFDDFEIITG